MEKSSPTITTTPTILSQYQITRNRTRSLCAPLSPEDYIPQPANFVSPPKWHLGHSTWFFEEFVLGPFLDNYKVFDSQFSYIFNSYYNTVGDRIPRDHRGMLTRPSVSRVLEYRSYVDAHIEQLLRTSIDTDLLELIQLGIQHEQQHQELLLTDLKYILWHNPLFPTYDPEFNLMTADCGSEGWLSSEGGITQIGFQGKGFSYDNEHSFHRVFLEPFQLSKDLVSNARWMDFINDGGYEDAQWWLDEGWQWVQEKRISSPQYWLNRDNQWHQFSLAGLLPVDLQSPVCHISFYEAAAFAEWSGKRLPTEFEWESLSDKLTWGSRWEWTNSAYLQYPGFKKPEGAIGEYNGKFMINQMVLRGASKATAEGHSRKTYRNFFHPHLRWQYTGLRLAE